MGNAGCADLHAHSPSLSDKSCHPLQRPINKDTEMHPLMRWQFRGGIPEPTQSVSVQNVIDSAGRITTSGRGRHLASVRQIYPVGIPVSDGGRTSRRNGGMPKQHPVPPNWSKIRPATRS